MKGKILLLPMFSIIFLHGCTSSRIMKMEITAVPSLDQKIGYDETVTSQKKHFVALSPYSKFFIGNRTMFMMSIQNHGEAPLDISYDNISVTFEDNTENGGTNKINVQSLHDVMNDFEMESRINELSFLLITLKSLGGGGMRVAAGASSDPITDTDTYFAMQDNANNLHEGVIKLKRMHEQNQQILDMMPDIIMSRQIIMPGDSYTGVVVFDTRQMNPTIKGNFKITISVDNEDHQFTFRRAISKR